MLWRGWGGGGVVCGLAIGAVLRAAARRRSWSCSRRAGRPPARLLTDAGWLVEGGGGGGGGPGGVFLLEESAQKLFPLPAVPPGNQPTAPRLFAVGHPGPQGLTNRPWPQQIADWRRIGE